MSNPVPEAPRLGASAGSVLEHILLEIVRALHQGPPVTNVYVSIPDTITVRIVQVRPAHSARLVIKPRGDQMPGQITVDTTNETVLLEWVDDHGDTDAAAPAGAVVAFTSDNEGVVTIASDPTNPLQGDITTVAEGDANIGASITDQAGNPILEPDGTTPFAVNPVAVHVSAGAAVGADLVLSQ